MSRIADAPVRDALEIFDQVSQPAHDTWRCGFTGPAGAGKSSLVGRFVNARLARQRRVGVVAIDPTSPYSQGALLGDRIRIDGYADNPELFVRSLASRRAHDGLADNLANIVALLAANDFDDVLVETVGAGQSQYEIRQHVDTLIVVLMPGAGDMIQAIKAGILECGDIYCVNKGDLTGARELVAEIKSVVHQHPDGGGDDWQPPVILASALRDEGVDALEDAAESHRQWHVRNVPVRRARRERLRAHVRALVQRRVTEVIDESSDNRWDNTVAAAYQRILEVLAGTDTESG